MKASEVLQLFKRYGVLDFINNFYDVLHTFGDRHILSEIEEFISIRQGVNN